MSDSILNVSRRGFLQGLVSTGALVLSVRLIPESLWAAAETAAVVTFINSEVLPKQQH